MSDESSPPDDALVLRGGTMRPEALLASALDAETILGVPAISVFAGDSSRVAITDLVDLGLVPHDVIRVSTVGRIRSAGFVIRRTGRYPHCSVELGQSPTLEEVTRLAGLFNGPIPNPRQRIRR